VLQGTDHLGGRIGWRKTFALEGLKGVGI